MASFMSLPNELINNTLEELDQNDLLTMCRVGRGRLQDLAETIVYRHVRIPWGNDPRPKIVLLFNTVTARPLLATLITTFELEGCPLVHAYRRSDIRYGNTPGPSPAAGLVAARVHAAIEALSPMDQEMFWRLAAPKGNIDALLALVVSQCLNLRSLTLPCWLDRMWVLQEALSFACCPYLDTIECIGSTAEPRRMHNDPEGMKIFFALPIRRLSLEVYWPTTIPAMRPCSRLTTLFLTNISEHFLGTILQACPHLKSFSWMLRYAGTSQAMSIDFAAFATALAHTNSTLKSLRIHVKGARSRWQGALHRDHMSYQGGISNLAGMAISKLRFPLPCQSPRNRVLRQQAQDMTLPDQVQELTITDDLWRGIRSLDMMDALEWLERVLHSRPYPNLRRVLFEAELYPGWETAAHTRWIEALARHYALEICVDADVRDN